MAFREDASALIQQKKFDHLEALWMDQIERDPSDVDSFLTVAKALRKAEQRSQADTLLGLLGDMLKERGLWPQRLQVLKEVGRLSKHPTQLRAPLEEALRKTFGERKSFARAFQISAFADPAGNPVERTEKIEAWMRYDEGECFFMTGRGAGVVTELNAELGVCRLDFEKDKRVSVPLGAAAKFLIPLPPGHVLREKFTDPEALQASAMRGQGEFLARLLQSFGRPMTMPEVRDAVIGVVPEQKWTSWWTAARKNPQIVTSGTGTKAVYSFAVSQSDAEGVIRRNFERADIKTKLDLAKKHSGRSSELAAEFAAALNAEAFKLARTEAGVAWQILTTLEGLGDQNPSVDPASLLSGPAASRTVASIAEKAMREKAIAVVRSAHPDWPKVYAELFFLDDEPRVLTTIISALEEEGHTEIRDRLIDETLRYPRRHPRAFYWYVKRLSEDEGSLPPRANYNLLFQILDALTHDEFASVRARLKDLFDKGGLAIRIIMGHENEEQARKLVDTLDRYGALEEYRRDTVRGAVHMKHPTLREPQAEPVYATAGSLERKRAELHHLKNVEIPANSKALQAAREMGDLRENFEYKAARARAEYLSARVGELAAEISRVRVLDPSQIDTSVVRVGTKMELSNGELKREVTILGPWESDPEHGVYSNQSEVATRMMGRPKGEVVSFMGNDYVIESIRRWDE